MTRNIETLLAKLNATKEKILWYMYGKINKNGFKKNEERNWSRPMIDKVAKNKF